MFFIIWFFIDFFSLLDDFQFIMVAFFKLAGNGHLQVVVADFAERQRPQDEDGQERNKDNAHHCTRNAICNLLCTGFYYFSIG